MQLLAPVLVHVVSMVAHASTRQLLSSSTMCRRSILYQWQIRTWDISYIKLLQVRKICNLARTFQNVRTIITDLAHWLWQLLIVRTCIHIIVVSIVFSVVFTYQVDSYFVLEYSWQPGEMKCKFSCFLVLFDVG